MFGGLQVFSIIQQHEVQHVICYNFFSDAERELNERFLADGYVIRPVDDLQGLASLRQGIVEIVCKHLSIDVPTDLDDFLNNFANYISIENLTNFGSQLIEQ